MKRLISLLLCALLIVPALAVDAPDFEPIPWDIKVSPNLPNPDCYLPNNGGYHDDSIDIQINVTYSTGCRICSRSMLPAKAQQPSCPRA